MRATEPARGGGGVRAALSQLLGVWGLNKQVQWQVILARAHALWQHAPPSQLDLDKSASVGTVERRRRRRRLALDCVTLAMCCMFCPWGPRTKLRSGNSQPTAQ